MPSMPSLTPQKPNLRSLARRCLLPWFSWRADDDVRGARLFDGAGHGGAHLCSTQGPQAEELMAKATETDRLVERVRRIGLVGEVLGVRHRVKARINTDATTGKLHWHAS